MGPAVLKDTGATGAGTLRETGINGNIGTF